MSVVIESSHNFKDQWSFTVQAKGFSGSRDRLYSWFYTSNHAHRAWVFNIFFPLCKGRKSHHHL